jgi:hypothetical protein
MDRIRIDLDPTEFEALAALSARELRPIPTQARVIVRQALKKSGLLKSQSDQARPSSHTERAHA